jgi:negative regulator of sigma E activity
MREQFMRIAMARLRKSYPFKPQRRAVAAKMWTEHLERYAMREWMRTEQELNQRMDIIGQNGNTGEHYEKGKASTIRYKAKRRKTKGLPKGYAAKYLAEQREKERPPIMKRRPKDDHLDIEHYE